MPEAVKNLPLVMRLFGMAENTDTAKWFANGSILIGAVTLSVSVNLSTKPGVFLFFLVGHVVWALCAAVARVMDRPQMALYLGYIVLDLYAIAIRL